MREAAIDLIPFFLVGAGWSLALTGLGVAIASILQAGAIVAGAYRKVGYRLDAWRVVAASAVAVTGILALVVLCTRLALDLAGM